MARQFANQRKGFTFTWIMENIEFCGHETGEFLKSPTFVVNTSKKSKWSLTLYPRGAESEGWISLYLFREEDNKGPATIDVDYELSILAPDGSVLTSQMDYKKTFFKNDSWGYSEFEEREFVFANRSKFLPDGALTIQCRIWKRTGEVEMDGQCIARTRIGVEREAFLWKMPNFSMLYIEEEVTFILKSTSNNIPIMSLIFCFDDDPDCIQNPYSIYFRNSNKRIEFMTFKSSLVDAEGNYENCGQDEFFFSPTEQNGVCELSLSEKTLMDRSDLYLPHDTLTLYCEVAFSIGTAFKGIEGTVYGCSPSFITNNLIPEYIKTADIKKSATDPKVDLGSTLRDYTLCDVKLFVESQTFPAHRFILSSRSLVFRDIFQRDLIGQARDRFIIKNLKPDTVLRMLHFMYTDSLGELQWETASDLYDAAVQFQIMTLKDKCSSFLKSNLDLSNACKILLFSHLHQDKELKETVQDFIIKNDKCIMNSSDWKEVMKDNVNLAAETMLLKFKK